MVVARDFSPWTADSPGIPSEWAGESHVRPSGRNYLRARIRRLKPPATIDRPPGENSVDSSYVPMTQEKDGLFGNAR